MPAPLKENPLGIKLYAMEHKEIGRRLNLTKMRICQIEKKALIKLRKEFARRSVTKEVIGEYLSSLDNKEDQYNNLKKGALHREINRWGNDEFYDAVKNCDFFDLNQRNLVEK